MLSWLHVLALGGAAELADQLGLDFDTTAWRRKASRISLAIDRRFWDSRRRWYAEWVEDGALASWGGQLTAAVALLSGGRPSRDGAR